MKKVREEVKALNRQMNQTKSGDVTRSAVAIELVEVMGISLTGDVSYSVMNVKGMVTSDLNVLLPNANNSNAGSVKVLVTLKLSVQTYLKEEKNIF